MKNKEQGLTEAEGAKWEQGLTEAEAAKRLARDGRNELERPAGKSLVGRFIEQLQDPLIYVLVVAAFVSVLLKEYADAAIIAAVVFLNACVGLVQEGRARKALEALENLQSPAATVIREGRRRRIPAAELAVGDIVCLQAGDRVPADVMLLEAEGMMTEESALTGESMPVEKEAVSKGMFSGERERELTRVKEPAQGDRRGEAFASSMVTAGRGLGMVRAVGMQTEIGKIAGMIRMEKEEPTPLQKRLGELGTFLSLLALLLCAALFVIAVLQKKNALQMLITAISLAVAAVPEGLPAVVTICLALSVTRLVRAGTIVRKLPSVETLGSVNVICSDKTGTLTQNRMRAEMAYWDRSVKSIRDSGRSRPENHGSDGERDSEPMPPENVPPELMLQGMVLCNDAALSAGGDPTELALLELGSRFGAEKPELEQRMPRIREIPFSPDTKQMTTFHLSERGRIGFRKGAPDVIVNGCELRHIKDHDLPMDFSSRQEILKVASELASMAYRTMAVAMKRGEDDAAPWSFLGLVALGDPVRPEAEDTVRLLKEAGVDVVMITGDHVKTALAIGRQLGIADQKTMAVTGDRLALMSKEELERELGSGDVRIFARTCPAQKVQIVKALQAQGKIVAMTGDGVNDAPSLKAADVGIAMGRNGTDVAREAADLILTDDHFAAIARAIEEGRGVYENIRKSVIFLLSSNLGELLTMFTAVLLGLPAPLKSSHVLWVNLITDSLPALALGVDRNDGGELMKCPPRKATESIFSRGGLGCTLFYGILIAGISLTAFFIGGQTYAFTVLGISQLFHAIGMRDVRKSIFRMNHLENKVMILAVIVGFALQIAVTEIPFLIRAFGTTRLCPAEWGRLTILASTPLIAREFLIFCNKKKIVNA